MGRIHQYGVPRSGTTMIYQILKIVCREDQVVKTHQFVETSEPIVATYRDFRDVLVSAWRVGLSQARRPYKAIPDARLRGRTPKPVRVDRKMTEEEVRHYIKVTRSSIRTLNKYKDYYRDKSNVLWLQYEKFFGDFAFVVDRLESFFGTSISSDVRESIEQSCSIEKNRERASRYQDFSEYGRETHIHGDHVYKGAIGGWRDLIPQALHVRVNKSYEKDLEEWGYEIRAPEAQGRG